MANATSTDLQELYVAYFGRAADPTGLDYWTAKGITTTKFAADMYAQAEFKDVYGSLSVEAQVNQIYKNLFDRGADVTGLTYWTQQINLGNLQLAEIATHLIWAAKNNSGSADDKTALSNRTDAAVAYTAKVKESTASILAYSPTSSDPWTAGANITEAVTYLSGINKDTASTAAGIAASVSTITTNGVQTATTSGKTYTLTTAVNAVTGTDGADSFSGSDSTLTVGDTIDGGAGTDTLSVAVNLTADTAIAGFTTTNVENLTVSLTDGVAADADTLTVNALNSSASKVTVAGLGSTTAEDTVTFNNLAAGTTVAMTNATDLNVTANYVTAATSGTADSVSIALAGVGSTADNDTTLTIGSGFETFNISSTGSASTLDGLTGSAKTWNITGDANLTLRAAQALDATLDVIDASAFTGKLSFATANDTSTPDATVSSVDVLDLTITGGSGNDTIVTANAADNEISIDGGAGDDNVTIVATPANASSTSAGDTLKGGAGTDTLTADVDLVDGSAVTTASPITGVSGFEVLALNGFAAAETITPANISSDITAVSIITATTGDVTVNVPGSFEIKVGGAAAILGADTLIADSGAGTADVLTITNSNLATGTNLIGDNATGITTTDFETVSIDTGSYSTVTAQLAAAINIGTANALTLSGSNGLTTTNSTGIITAKTIDASAMTGALVMGAVPTTGVTTITGGSGNDTLVGDASSTISGGAGDDGITGGSGNDTLSGGSGNDTFTPNGGTDAMTGGAGNDTFTVAGNLSALDTIDGGDGTDTISLTNASLTTLNGLSISDANTFNAGFDNVEKLTISDALDQGTFDIGYLDSVNYVVVGSNITNNETLSGFDSGDTLELTTADTDTLTAGVNSSSTGTTDTLNVKLTTGASTDYGVLSVANVETLNIDGSETTANATVRANTIGLTITQVTSGSAQTVNFTGVESLTVDTTIAAGTIDASGLTTVSATDAGLTMTGSSHTSAQTITGSAKVDTLIGSTKADTINGGAGADNITGSTGSDTIDGGTGTDTYKVAAAQVGANPEGTGTGTSVGVAVNLSDSAITGATVFAQDGDYLSNGSTLAAGTVRYLFAAEASTNSAAATTLTNIENIDVALAGTHYVKGSTAANTIFVGNAAEVTARDTYDGGDTTAVTATDTISVNSDADATGAVFNDLIGIDTITATPDATTAANDIKISLTYTAANTDAITIDLTGRTDASAAAVLDLSNANADGYYTVNGGTGADTVTTGDGGALLTLGAGADVITGDTAGVETYVFASTAALNGVDKIAANFTVATTLDILNFKNCLPSGAFNTTMVATGGTADVQIANKVVMWDAAVTDANSDSRADGGDTAGEIAATVQGTGDVFALTSGAKGIIIAGNDSNATIDAIVWLVDDSLGGTTGSIEADDVKELTSIVNFDLDTLVAGNFAFA
jgi:hypothetical protein